MNAFDKVIGYESIKAELQQICDMIHNREAYEKLGAKLPQGILLYGDPGLGKTLMAKCFIEESGLPSYIVRRNKGNDDFVGEITKTFAVAKENAPAVVFLDDMDKFANEDDHHRDAEEYVAVQAGIDEVKNSDVFVLATVNDEDKLPRSLIRAGRFDRKIEIECPTAHDAKRIIEYYLSNKPIFQDVDMEDLSRMISYNSCAELETILNEAAIYAANARKDCIGMEDLVRAVLRTQYNSPDDFAETSREELMRTALHEAGHLVVSEVLEPGSIGLASLKARGRGSTGGFVHRCTAPKRRAYEILIALGSKAAVELYYSETCASGCQYDIHRAYDHIRRSVSTSGTNGLGMIEISNCDFRDPSESMNTRNEAVVHAELERYMFKTRDILLKNRKFLEKAAKELMQKETLLYSDIRRIRESVKITGPGTGVLGI